MSPKAICTYRDFATATAEEKSAYKLVRWLLSTGRFPEYRLAKRYRAKARKGAEALATEARRYDIAAYH
jgi:hypothetical protein